MRNHNLYMHALYELEAAEDKRAHDAIQQLCLLCNKRPAAWHNTFCQHCIEALPTKPPYKRRSKRTRRLCDDWGGER